jgi:hypothetical protein
MATKENSKPRPRYKCDRMEDLRLRTTYIVVRRVKDHYSHGLTCEDIVEVCSQSYSTPIIPVRITQLMSQAGETSEFLVELSSREQVELIQMKVSGMIHWKGRPVSCYAIEPSIDMLKVYGGKLVLENQQDLRKGNKEQSVDLSMDKLCGKVKTFSDSKLNHLSDVVDAELRKRMNQLTTNLTDLVGILKSHVESLKRASEETLHVDDLQEDTSTGKETLSSTEQLVGIDSLSITGRVVDKPIHISSNGIDNLQEMRYHFDSGSSIEAELLKSRLKSACFKCGSFDHLQIDCSY